MALKLSAVGTLPVTLAEAKLHLRVEISTDDALITTLISAATQTAEQHIERSVSVNTWALKLDAFPAHEIRLLMPPIVSITSVQYLDALAANITMPTSAYVLDAHSEPGWLLPAANTEWPVTYDSANAVTITYTAGYGASCPESIKAWILLRIGSLYENRESVSVGQPIQAAPHDFADGLLDRYKIYA